MISKIARASDSIWHTADLEHGDPYEDDDEAGWFRDKHNMFNNYGSNDRNEELMTLIPGWDEAKRKGWKPLGRGAGPIAYRGKGPNFEFIAPKHVTPDGPHWESIPQRWIRYTLGEGGMADPFAMHAETFKDAINDRNLRGWNLYKNHFDPETQSFHQELNKDYPSGHPKVGPGAFVDVFTPRVEGQQGHFNYIKDLAERNDRRLAGEA